MAAKPGALPRDPDLAKFIYDMLRDLLDAGMKQQEMAETTGVSTATISNILTNEGTYGVGRKMATDLGKLRGFKSYDEVLDAAYSDRLSRLKASTTNLLDTLDLTAGSFLLKLRRLPGLERWVEDHPGALLLADLAKGIVAYDASPPRSREDGQPLGGWEAFFADVKADRLTGPKKTGDQSAAEKLEAGQMSKATRRRLKK